MTIEQQIRLITEELIAKYGKGYIISIKELHEICYSRFYTAKRSIIPSDYCYNRVNRGINFQKQPHFFSFLGKGMYKCLGENDLFSGEVYTRPKGETVDIKIGEWRKGILYPNANWGFYLDYD